MLTIFRVVFGFLCFLKAIDIGTRGGDVIGLASSLLIAIPWAVASVAFMLGRVRIASAVIIAGTVAVSILSRLELYNQHLYLIASICLIFLIGRAVPTLLKAQLSIVYSFAVLTKLNEAFLSGTVIYASAVKRPFWDNVIGIEPEAWFLIPLSVFSILTEAFLAVAFWLPRARWVALVVGVGFHAVMLVLMTADPASFLRLSIFGFLMMALYIPFFKEELDRLYSRFIARGQHRSRRIGSVGVREDQTALHA
jgi:hypothetical protein